ncbi:MAG: HIT domain-containing protein, partial [Zestosphaera sp.]
VARIEQLTREEVLDLFEVLSRVIKAIDQEYSPQGYNIGVNVGRVAGAGVESHVHVHVVPRWLGDTNFMPVIAGTKVMPEDLRSTYARLRNRVVSQDSIR